MEEVENVTGVEGMTEVENMTGAEDTKNGVRKEDGDGEKYLVTHRD